MVPRRVSRLIEQWLRPYRLLKEPRVVSLLLALCYAAIAFGIGLPTITNVPDTILGVHVDYSLAVVVGLFALGGGIMAASSLLGGAWFVERTGIVFIMGALAARAAIVVFLPMTDAQTIVRVAELLTIGLLLGVRLRIVGQLALDPTKGAAR